uniref:Uncharacterized protein n=1 Tax=Anguilla anguilla TaxID=7936 RepID=A0A0E9RNT0_ANGAN
MKNIRIKYVKYCPKVCCFHSYFGCRNTMSELRNFQDRGHV